jgi:integrase
LPIPSDSEATTWLAVVRAGGRSPKTLLQYSYALCELEAAVNKPLAEVTRAEAVATIEAWRFRWKPGGVALRLRVLRAFYNHLVAEEVIIRSPFPTISIKVQDQPRPTATDADVDAMLAKARTARDKCIITLLADTGARKGEVAA